jgi:hypothetical protein
VPRNAKGNLRRYAGDYFFSTTSVPDLALAWKAQVDSMRDYRNFKAEDFLRLREEFGTNWALVEKEIPGLSCPYRRDNLAVCRIE